MATIDPNGVLIYQDTDNYTPIQTALNLAQSNLSSILGANTQIVRVSSVGDRDAKATARGSISKSNPFVAWRADAADGLQLEYTTNGTTWRTIADKEYYDAQDTGWVTSGLTVTGNANFTVSAYVMRRIGKHVKGRISVTFTGSPLSSDAGGDFTNVALPTIPAAWAPTGFSAPITMERVGAAVSFGWAATTGQLSLVSSSLQSAVVLATGAPYVIYLDHFTG